MFKPVACVLALLLALGAALVALAPTAAAAPPPVAGPAADPVTEPAADPWVEPAERLGPDELSTTLGRIGLVLPGQQLTLLGTGFRPGDTAEATLDPATPAATPLGTGTIAGGGDLSLPVTLPAGLGVGEHTIIVTGSDPAGATATATLRAATPPTALTTTGTDTQSVTLPIPAGGWVTLLDNNDNPVTQVRSRNQGTYSLDPSTGRVTFAPDRMFWGAVRPVHFRLTDAAGQVVRGIYSPDVAARPLPSVRAAERTLTDASGETARIGCTAGPIPVVTCEVTLSVVVGTEYIVLGTGSGQTTAPRAGTRIADVALTPAGRRLAGRPGGIAADVLVRMWVPDRPGPVKATGSTVLTALTVTAPRAIRYPAAGVDVPEADLRYLNALRSRMTDVTTVTCTGGTDNQGDAEPARRVAAERARRVCDYLTANTRTRAVVQSVGQDQPVAGNTTEEGRARNRRVEITFGYTPESSS